jgi:hypothetical protein
VQGDVQKASNGGAWDQPGLTTSKSDAVGGLTSIGVATGAQVRGLGPTDTDTFAGQTINGNSTIAMYTYAGDANLDGAITGDDYSAIDFNILVPGADGWYNGDFNYDGAITGDDYSAIDFNILAQGAPFSTAGGAAILGSVTAVPERLRSASSAFQLWYPLPPPSPQRPSSGGVGGGRVMRCGRPAERWVKRPIRFAFLLGSLVPEGIIRSLPCPAIDV